MIDINFIKENKDFFEKLNFIKNKEKRYDILFNYLYNIENQISKNNNRESAILILNIRNDKSQLQTSTYDVANNKIEIDYHRSLNPTEFILSFIHEVEHANQSLSPLRTPEEKELIEISDMLYLEPPDDGSFPYYYTCNYKELGAKLIEMNTLIDLYEETKSQYEIIPISIADEFTKLFENLSITTNSITNFNIDRLIVENISRTLRNDYNTDIFDKPKSIMLKSLLLKAPSYFQTMKKEVLLKKKQMLQIQKELNTQYIDNREDTKLKLEQLEIDNQDKGKAKYQKVIDGMNKKAPSLSSDLDIQKEMIYSNEELIQRIQQLEKDETVTNIFISEDFINEKHLICYNVLEPLKESDDFFSNDEKYELTTSIDEKEQCL